MQWDYETRKDWTNKNANQSKRNPCSHFCQTFSLRLCFDMMLMFWLIFVLYLLFCTRRDTHTPDNEDQSLIYRSIYLSVHQVSKLLWCLLSSIPDTQPLQKGLRRLTTTYQVIKPCRDHDRSKSAMSNGQNKTKTQLFKCKYSESQQIIIIF